MKHPESLPASIIEEYSDIELQRRSYSYDATAYYHTLNGAYHKKSLNMHSHSFYELNFIINGEGWHYFADKTICVKQGDFFLINPHVKHGYWSEEKLQIFHILISSKFLFEHHGILKKRDGYFSLFNIQPLIQNNMDTMLFPRIEGRYFDYLRSIAERLCDIFANDRDNIPVLGENLIITFLLELESYISVTSSNFRKDSNYIIFQAMEYIMQNFNKDLKFDNVARHFNMSYSTFYRKFISVNSISPTDFLHSYKIQYVCNMILFSDSSLTEIAQSAGYYDSSHLTKAFYASKHMTPTEYKKLFKDKV